MKNMELLAPAGNMDSLKQAVYNGADAVYLGIKQFNARNNIEGFNFDNLAQAVDFAHLFGVKVYLALNILFEDDELQDALDLVVEANNRNVDAFIVQDLGLVYLIKKYYPSIELHASTQMAVHSLEGVRVLEKLGFSRAVLARETSVEEIRRIHENSNIEIEFFVQGALCVSFSGNCYMCSHLVDKSGNRGLCQQFCRLPYTFNAGDVNNRGYLLSAKDICMLDNLNFLSDLGISSLKIEGRARRPFYVAKATQIYRKALNGEKISTKDLDELKIAFNRNYTPAYFKGNGNIISSIQGNNGLEIGEVVKVKNGAKFNEIFISTKYDLKGKSGLKFTYKGQEIASIGAYDIQKVNELYRVTTTSSIKLGSKVNIIQDDVLEERVLSKTLKLKIDVDIIANPDENIKCVATFKSIKVGVEGEKCIVAKTIATQSEQILKQFSRSEIFEIGNFNCNNNNCYILNSTINHLRNDLYATLTNKIIKKYSKQKLSKVVIEDLGIGDENINFNYEIVESVHNLNANRTVLYDYANFVEEDFYKLDRYCNQNNIDGYIDIPNFATKQDIDKIVEILEKTNLGVVANNLYALTFNCKMIGGQFLNVYNSFTLHQLNLIHNLQAQFVEELGEDKLSRLKTNMPLLKREKVYMTLLHCPFKQNVGCNCADCKYTDSAIYTINSGKKFKIKRKKTAGCVFLLKD